MAADLVVGSALPTTVTLRRLAGGTSTVEIVGDCENLKGRLHKKRSQTSIWRRVDWSLVGKRDEIVVLERRGQRRLLHRLAAHQDFPEALRLRRIGECRKSRLQRYRLLALDRKEGRHEDPSALDREDRKVDLRHRLDMEEIGWMGDRQLAAAWQCIMPARSAE